MKRTVPKGVVLFLLDEHFPSVQLFYYLTDTFKYKSNYKCW